MRFAKAYLEITNVCNLACAFCPGTKRSPAMMTQAQFTLLAERLRPYTDYLYFHLMGEPLLHPELGRFLELAGALGFRVILTTNGTLLPKLQPLLLQAPALHKVNISLHAFEANAGAAFSACVSGCVSFAKAAAQRGILINLRLWNLDGMQTTGLHERNGEILDLVEVQFPKPWAQVRGGRRLGERVYLCWGERFDWPSLEEADRGEARRCYGLKDQIGVLADGTVVPCCLDHEGDIPLGNLLVQTMEEILSGPRAQAICEGFRRHRAVEALCRRCGYSTRFSVDHG